MQKEQQTTTDGGTQTQQQPTRHTPLRLRTIMQARAVNMPQLAEATGMHVANISLLVSGKRNPTLDTLDRLAQALDVPTWHLLQDPAEQEAALQAERTRADELQARVDRLSEQVLRLTEVASPQPQPDSPALRPLSGDSIADSPAADTAPTDRPQTATDAPAADLITVDPRTGETRLYRLINV